MSLFSGFLDFITRWISSIKEVRPPVAPYNRGGPTKPGTVGAYEINNPPKKVEQTKPDRMSRFAAALLGIKSDTIKPYTQSNTTSYAFTTYSRSRNDFQPFDFGGRGAFDFPTVGPSSYVLMGYDPKAWPKDPRQERLP